MKRVVILGAKPNARLVAGDAVYCANAAFLPFRDALAAFPWRVIVASTLILAKGIREGVENSDVYRMKVDAVRDSGADRLVLFADPGRANHLSAVRGYLALEGAKPPEVTEYSVFERLELVKRIAGVSYPVIDETFHAQPLGVRLRDTMENLVCAYNWRFGDRKKDVRAKYRPSTGVLALLVAIAENGADTEYVLSGIGLENRNVYQIEGRTVALKQSAGTVLPRHRQADIIVLHSLRRSYNIRSTETELYRYVDPFEPLPA